MTHDARRMIQLKINKVTKDFKVLRRREDSSVSGFPAFSIDSITQN